MVSESSLLPFYGAQKLFKRFLWLIKTAKLLEVNFSEFKKWLSPQMRSPLRSRAEMQITACRGWGTHLIPHIPRRAVGYAAQSRAEGFTEFCERLSVYWFTPAPVKSYCRRERRCMSRRERKTGICGAIRQNWQIAFFHFWKARTSHIFVQRRV